jgi:hypothetical protein
MPNRILRDWTDSEAVDLLSIYAERFFTRLIMKVDDYGRYSANLKLLKSALFPLKTDVRETDVSRWLSECEQSGLVVLYNVASKGYLQIINFKQVLRQKHEKFPSPPDNITCLADDKQTTSICFPETKGNEVETETKKKPPTDFSKELKKDSIFGDPLKMNWQLSKESFSKMIDAFNLYLGSKGKTHPDYGEYKSHFFNWGLKKYNDFKAKEKQMVD